MSNFHELSLDLLTALCWFQVPIIIPVMVLVISIYLIIAPIMDNPTIEYFYAAMFILSGMMFYVPFVHYQIKIPFMGK